MKGISTVSILILTVFLSISVLPACADPTPPGHPVLVFGHVEDVEDGTVTITANGASVEVPIGNYGANYWIADLSDVGVRSGDPIEVSVATADGTIIETTKCITDPFSLDGMAPAPPSDGDGSSGGDGTYPSGGSGGSREGTYPPGWGETPTPTPTPEPEDTQTPTSTATTESVTPDDEEAVTPTETATEDETDTKTPLNTDPAKDAPGFGAVFMISGLLAAVYLVLHRRE
ncbi:MAG: hypothetical protein EF813_12535 [Methanosarcinales archaeon]|nr:MAG: hypothetical protein EF813_12535 [Methanosarcinales archaeon]